MDPFALDIRESRAAVEQILEGLALRDFVFTIEPKERGWALHVECTTEQGWQTVALPADPAELRASLRDLAVRDRLREAWRERLAECARRRAQPPEAGHPL
jgi:hypothetical protein